MDKQPRMLSFTFANNFGAILQNHALKSWLMANLSNYWVEDVNFIAQRIWPEYELDKSVRHPLLSYHIRMLYSKRLFSQEKHSNDKGI